jgi:ribosomal protein S18 acetylase RimI-like enzyme
MVLKNTLKNDIKIIDESHATYSIWKQAANIIIQGIPNSIISHFGVQFNILFYRYMAESAGACAFFAINSDALLDGIIIGALDRDKVYYNSIRRKPLTMLISASYRLFSPSAIKWVLNGLLTNNKKNTQNNNHNLAELIVIAVSPTARGKGVAQLLVNAMEYRFREMGCCTGYAIYTERSNIASNKFYAKIGAQLVSTDQFHGREINRWHKGL